MKIFLSTIGALVGLNCVLYGQTLSESAAWVLTACTSFQRTCILTTVLQFVIAARLTTYLLGFLGFKASDISSSSVAGKTILITGANSGTGFHAALELARKGAHVTLACRDPTRGANAVTDLKKRLEEEGAKSPGGSIDLVLMDLSDLPSVEKGAQQYVSEMNKSGKLDILINNAGIGAQNPRKAAKSKGNLELQMCSNHVGHFLLMDRLKSLLNKADEPRVVHVSSLAAWGGGGKVDDMGVASLTTDGAAYDPLKQYNHSKLAQYWLAQEFCRRNPGTKIRQLVCHPGASQTAFVEKTMLANDLAAKVSLFLIMQTSAAGAWSQLAAAVTPYSQIPTDGTAVFSPMFGTRGPAVRGWLPPQAKASNTAKKQAEFWDATDMAIKKALA